MSQISHLLVMRLTDTLDLEMRVNTSGPTKAGLVQAYRFQDNPLEKVNYLYVSAGNPQDPDLQDARVSARDMENLGMNLPAGEVGGGHYWWRRGRIALGCYFITKNYTQEVAADYAHTFLGRVMHHTERANVSDLVDDWGEEASYLMVFASTFFEGGGPPNQFIWRGHVLWQVLTHRPY